MAIKSATPSPRPENKITCPSPLPSPCLNPLSQPPAPKLASRQQPQTHQSSANAQAFPPARQDGITQAAAYASVHRRDKGKPIFDWISRKLGGGRRATWSDISSPVAPAMVSTPLAGPSQPRSSPRNMHLPLPKSNKPIDTRQAALSPKQIFTPASPTRQSSMSRTESHSMRSYSVSISTAASPDKRTTWERRQANNPYPSLPVPYRQSTIDSESHAPSMSFLTRSRTPSMSSETSSIRRHRRFSLADDGSSYRPTGRWADEDASLRPIPPSHPASPTPSASYISRSASFSASLVARNETRLPSPQRPKTHHSTSSNGPDTSLNSTDADERDTGRQSRQDSTSTKPTTIMSFETGPYVGHIAQPPLSPSATAPNTSVPPSALSTARPAPRPVSLNSPSPLTPSPIIHTPASTTNSSPSHTVPSALVQAPKHSAPHPRDNPHPASPPEPNASTLTLASSTFGLVPSPLPSVAAPAAAASPPPSFPFSHSGQPSPAGPVLSAAMAASRRPTSLATSPSVTWAREPLERPVSVYEPSYPTSTHALSIHVPGSLRTGGTAGWGGGRLADRDASVRAVRRKGSWESYESGWSWRPAAGSAPLYGPQGPMGTSSPAAPVGGSPNIGGSSSAGHPEGPSASASPVVKPDDDAVGFGARDSMYTRESFMTGRSKEFEDGITA